MRLFFKKMMSASTDVSSKRFISIYSLCLLTIVIGSNLFGVEVSDTVYYTLVGLILGGSAMTLITNKNVQ